MSCLSSLPPRCSDDFVTRLVTKPGWERLCRRLTEILFCCRLNGLEIDVFENGTTKIINSSYLQRLFFFSQTEIVARKALCAEPILRIRNGRIKLFCRLESLLYK